MPKLTPGEVVRSRRQQLGLSREKLAVQSETSVTTIVRIENLGQLPTVRTLAKIADVLGLTLDEIARAGR